MIQKIKQRVFPFLIALSALSVSASAAFYSISGLSKLFAGAAFAVILMNICVPLIDSLTQPKVFGHE